MKKAELIKLLDALRENAIGLAQYYEKENNVIETKRYYVRASALIEVKMLLTNKEYAKQIKDIFLPES